MAHACHPKKLFWHFFEKKQKKVSKTKKTTFISKTLSFWIVRMGIGGCDAVSQYWDMLACILGWNVKSWFVILGRLKNFIWDHLSKLRHVPAKFQRFWQLGRSLITEKMKSSLIAPVLMTSKSVTGSPCRYLDKRYCLSTKSTLPINIIELCRKLCHREQQGLREGDMRGTSYPGRAGTGPGKIIVRMVSFSVIKLKIISVNQLPV